MKVNVGAVFELFKTAVICIRFVVKITTLMFKSLQTDVNFVAFSAVYVATFS